MVQAKKILHDYNQKREKELQEKIQLLNEHEKQKFECNKHTEQIEIEVEPIAISRRKKIETIKLENGVESVTGTVKRRADDFDLQKEVALFQKKKLSSKFIIIKTFII